MEQPSGSVIIPATTINKISTGYRVERSASGNPIDELKSGLQKYSRRGETSKAMRCATELYAFRLAGQDGRGKGVYTNLIHRLMIIYLEDIGPANYELWELLDLLLTEMRKEDNNLGREEDNQPRIALGWWVYALCNSKHSRTLSHFGSVFNAGCMSFQKEVKTIVGLETICEDSGVDGGVDGVMKFAEKKNAFEKKCHTLGHKVSQSRIYPRFVQERTLPSGKKDEGDSRVIEGVVNMLTLLDRAEDGCFVWMYRILMQDKVGKHFGGSKPGLLVLDVLKWYVLESRLCMSPGVRDRLVEFENMIEIAVRWYKELGNLPEAKLCVGMVLMWILLAMQPSLTEDGSSLLDDEESIRIYNDMEVEAFENLGDQLVLDDYVVDMHTKRGKSMNKNRIDFAEEGSFVVNEDTRVTNPLYKQFYNLLKRIQNNNLTTKPTRQPSKQEENKKEHIIPANPLRPPPLLQNNTDNTPQQPQTPEQIDKYLLESITFIFDVRAQATCSDSRPDTYFALDTRKDSNNSNRVFVKGPYKTAAEALIPIQLTKVKILFDGCVQSLDNNTLELVYLLPDAFPDVPLGIRRHVDRTKPHWFVVSPNLVPPFLPEYDRKGNASTNTIPISRTGMPTKQHTTKCWGEITVVDWDAVLMIPHAPYIPSVLNMHHRTQKYILALLWRYVMGIPDPADRNFLIDETNNRLYSLDEEGINHTTDYYNALKKKKCEHIKLHLRAEYGEISRVLQKWLECVIANENEIKTILKQKSIKWLVDKLTNIQTLQAIERIFSPSK